MENFGFGSDGPAAPSGDTPAPSNGSVASSNGMLLRFSAPHPNHQFSFDNNSPAIRLPPVLTKKQILIGCLIGSLLTILLIISTGLALWKKPSIGYETTTTITLSQSSTKHTTTATTTIFNQTQTTSTETLTLSPRPCSIPAVNASWNNSGAVLVNPLAQCLSNKTGLCHPTDLFIDNIHDTLYVVDQGNNRIQKYSLTEIYNSKVGATGITVASKGLILPQSVFVDIHTEDMYIMDYDQNETYVPGAYVSGEFVPAKYASYRVHLWKKNNSVGRILFSEEGGNNVQIAHCVTLDKQMNIYVGTRFYIKKWLASTNYSEYVIVAGKNQDNPKLPTDLFDPVGLYVTDDLTLYIADWQNKRIQKWKANATEGTTVIENLTYVMGITMDCNGHLYYVETYDSAIYQLNMVVNQTRMIARNEDDLKRPIYYWPHAIKTDRFGNFFATANNQVYKFSILQK